MGKTKKSVILHRRTLVARLRLRGLGLREIQQRLATPDEYGNYATLNPGSKKPWSLTTIGYDSKALDDEWMEQAQQDANERRALMLAETQEVKREAWRTGNLKVVLAAQKQERALYGLDSPKRAEISGVGGGPIATAHLPDLALLNDEELAQYEQILRRLAADGPEGEEPEEGKQKPS